MVTRGDIEAILVAFEKSAWRSIRLVADGVEVELSKDGPPAPAAPALPPAAAAPMMPAVAEPAGVGVVAPSLGTFYRAPRPGERPFVEVGQRVAVGDDLCLIEVMKLFTSVQAPEAGIVVAVHAADGDLVEHGQRLFTIAPA
ncbi:acetyl-CoA carboxylase biotin carboxyl carrier protein [Thermaurantiacus sp.]